jgi:hypothetical protein
MIEVEKHVKSDQTFYFIKGTNIYHREDGPAREWLNGDKLWFINGRRHRDGGPAIEWGDRSKEWFVNGKRHREDGPALVYTNGRIQWWLNGRIYTKKDWFEALNEEQKVKALYSEYFIGG